MNASDVEPRSLTWAQIAFLFAFALAAILPGLWTLPPTDRDESRYAVASTQMMTSGDFIDIRFQDEPRYLQPAGIYWLQSAAVSTLGSPEAREIGPYRVPSLLGAAIAVVLTGLLGALAFGRTAGMAGALLLGASLALGFEGRIAKTDAALLAAITTAQFALLRIYLDPNGHVWRPLLFWSAVGVGMMLKGPIILIFCGLTIIGLALWDRRANWLAGLRPLWGVPLLLAIVLPWYIAIGVVSDWHFYIRSVGENLLGKVGEGQQAHGGPPGYHLLALPIAFWPGSLFAILALPFMWKRRAEPAIRFFVAWIVPAWLVFEIVATKLPHYVLPTYPAIACLAAAALFSQEPLPRWAKIATGVWVVVWLLASAITIGLAPGASWYYERAIDIPAIILAAIATVLALIALTTLLLKRQRVALACAVAAGVLVTWNALGFTMPRLDSFWLTPRITEAARSFAPCDQTFLISTEYREPSLVFQNGPHETLFGDTPEQAAALYAANAPCSLAIVMEDEANAFAAALTASGAIGQPAQMIEGVNYSDGDLYRLVLFAPSVAPR